MWETWKPISFIPTHEVSNLGNVRHIKSKKVRKPYLDKYGYLQLNIFVKPKIRTFKIHKIVALVFIPNPNNKPQINHINGIKTDNRVENLEWCSSKENIKHAHRLGLSSMKQLEEYYRSKEKPIAQIKNGIVIKTFPSIHSAAKYVGCGASSISKACHGYKTKIKGFEWKFVENLERGQ